jgi:hypothetical protein
MKLFRYDVLAGVLLSGLAVSSIGQAQALTFFDSLTGGTLNPNLSISATSGFSAALTNDGVVFAKDAGFGKGTVEITSNFTFSGNFTLSVFDLFPSTLGPDGEAGLLVFNQASKFADVFHFADSSDVRSNNSLPNSVSFTYTPVAKGGTFTISGFTNEQLTLDVFLTEEFGGTSANTITFRDLSLTADSFSPNFVTSPVPEPSTWAMMLLGFAGVSFIAFRRKSKPAALAVHSCQ